MEKERPANWEQAMFDILSQLMGENLGADRGSVKEMDEPWPFPLLMEDLIAVQQKDIVQYLCNHHT